MGKTTISSTWAQCDLMERSKCIADCRYSNLPVTRWCSERNVELRSKHVKRTGRRLKSVEHDKRLELSSFPMMSKVVAKSWHKNGTKMAQNWQSFADDK